MHLRFLRTFLAVARTRNLTRAAEAVHLAQSSVSDQIQALETRLGVELFTRTRQGLRLTRAGQALRAYAEEIVALTDEACVAVLVAAGCSAESLTVGALETIGAVKLPYWLGEFQGLHPDVALNVKIAPTGELLRGVVDGTLDAVFCLDRPFNDERLARRVVASDALVFIGPADNQPLPVSRDLAVVRRQRFIATERGCIYRHLFDQAFAAAGVEPPGQISEVGSIAAIGHMVAAGSGWAIVPRMAVAAMLERGELVEHAFPGGIGKVSIVLIWRRRRVQRPALQSFLAAADGWRAGLRSGDVHLPHAESSPS